MPHQTVSEFSRTNARNMRKSMTDAELKLWNELRAHRLMGLGFKRQVPIGKFIVDFACVKYRLIIELDGSQHANEGHIVYDQQRTAFLREQGWLVIRFWNDDVIKDVDGVCQHILAVLSKQGIKFK